MNTFLYVALCQFFQQLNSVPINHLPAPFVQGLPEEPEHIEKPLPLVKPPELIGGEETEVGGCCVPCGYQYCPDLDECVRPWETYCQALDFPYELLYLNHIKEINNNKTNK